MWRKLGYRNLFLLIGVLAVVLMLCTFEVPYAELWQHIRRAGYWFWAVVLLWLPIYLLNAWAWYLLIPREGVRVPFWRIFKYTVSGYALNYVTPVGVLGGEPYRIMELTPYVGVTKATSSVLLYAMMHIFSHFWFWACSLFLFILCYASLLSAGLVGVLCLMAAFCALGIYFFMRGYQQGVAKGVLGFLSRWPVVGKRVRHFQETHADTLQQVDEQIAALHRSRRGVFYASLCLEFIARVVGCLEVMFILFMLPEAGEVSFIDCMLMQAFMSLFANLMFFIPLEMGTREGGFAMVTSLLRMSRASGLLTGLVTRVREMIWIVVGLLLIKIGNHKHT